MSDGARRSWVPVALTAVALLALAGLAMQRREVAGLRLGKERAEAVRREAADRRPEPGPGPKEDGDRKPGPVSPVSGPGEPLTAEERVQLMALRSQVTDLRARQRALAGATNGTEALRARLVAVSNYARGSLPAGFVRRTEARNLGQATPEAAVETFFWALEHREAESLIRVMPVENQPTMRRVLEEQGAVAFFKEMPPLPGFRISGRVATSPEEVSFILETGPGKPWPIKAFREEGAWRLQL